MLLKMQRIFLIWLRFFVHGSLSSLDEISGLFFSTDLALFFFPHIFIIVWMESLALLNELFIVSLFKFKSTAFDNKASSYFC